MSASHKASRPNKAFLIRLVLYLWYSFKKFGFFLYKEFKHFFSKPKGSIPQNFLLTTRYHISSMGLWCATGIVLIHTVYYLLFLFYSESAVNFHATLEHISHRSFAFRHWGQDFALFIHSTGFYLISTLLFTALLLLWLYLHYYYGRKSRKISVIFSIIFILISNLEGLISPSDSFAHVWLIIAPIVIIPSLGNRRALIILTLNIVFHHLIMSSQVDEYYSHILTSVATIFVAIFIMMMQLEYYRREVRLHQSASRLSERALEIELIKKNMNSGLMLLDPELKVRPNYSDLCVKLLHKKNLRGQYFPSLLRQIIEENQFFTMSHVSSNYMDNDDDVIDDPAEWEERVKHYFEMLAGEQLDKDELASIDPLRYVKIYSYEGRSYISFQISTIKMNDQIQYFMVLISNETGKVAGRYRIREHERKQLERAQLLFALSHNNPTKQLHFFRSFAYSYLSLCKYVLTDLRSNTPPLKLSKMVSEELVTFCQIFEDLRLAHHKQEAEKLNGKCQQFLSYLAELEQSGNVMIIDKAAQAKYIQLVVDCEKFLSELRSLFSIAACFIREPQLHEELQKQKQALHYGLSQDTLQGHEMGDFYETQLSQEAQMFVNLYTAFEMLLSEHDLQNDLKLIDDTPEE